MQNTIIPNTKLPQNFFQKNTIKEISPARLTYFQASTLNLPDFNNQIASIVTPSMDTARRDAYEAEKKLIASITTADEAITFMRKIKEPQNREPLLNKTLEMQDEVMPLILKRLVRSAHDVFIEGAAIALCHADMKYTEQLYDIFHEIRTPYAKSESCLVFGFKKKIEYTPLLLEQFRILKQDYPEKEYEQGPLLALYSIHGA